MKKGLTQKLVVLKPGVELGVLSALRNKGLTSIQRTVVVDLFVEKP